jgi:hypothetical protein
MNPTLARQHGIPAKSSRKINLPSGHPWQPLAAFLANDQVWFFEQERIDPEPISIVKTLS